MTDISSQEAIKGIYQDNFYSLPENRHKRDDLIKKILLEQNELDNKKAPPK
jgi:hypothetical protein